MKKTFQLAAGLVLSTTLALTQIPALPVIAGENEVKEADSSAKKGEEKTAETDQLTWSEISINFTSNEETAPEIRTSYNASAKDDPLPSFDLKLPPVPENIPEELTFIGFRADFGKVNVEGNGQIYEADETVTIPAEKILTEQEDKTQLNLVFEALYEKEVDAYDLQVNFDVDQKYSDLAVGLPYAQLTIPDIKNSVYEYRLPSDAPWIKSEEDANKYEFIGWQGLDVRLYQPGDTVTLTAQEMEKADEDEPFSTTFVAQFEEVPQTKTLTLTYLNAEGKPFETQKIEAEAAAGFIGKTEIIDKEPEKDGWTFSHWEHGGRDDGAPDTDTDPISWYSRKVENEEGNKEAYPNCYGDLCTSKDLTLYPVFEKDIQYISYDKSDLDTQKLYWHPGENKEGVFSDFTIEVDNPEVEDYTFEGWHYGKKNYQKGEVVPDLKEDSTLKAVFSYEVNVRYLDGSTDLKLGQPQKGSTDGYTLKLTNEEATKSGKTFQGWSFKGKTYKPGASISISDLAKEFEVKAVFTSGKTPVPSNPKNPTPTGNYSYYYNPDGSYIKRRKLTLADNSDNQFKSFYMRLTMDEDSPYSEDKGYKLIGWKSGDTLYRLGAVVRKADIEAPMQFTAVVSYDADIEYKVDGVTVLNHEQSITTDGKQKDPGGSFKATDFIPVKEGYVFKGWSLSGNGSLIEPNDDVTTTDLSRTLSMEAEFEPDTGSKGYSYQFRYLDQDGNVYDYGTISGTRANSSETFSGSVSQSFKTLGEGPSKSGDKFVGWAIGTNPPVFVRAGEPIGAYSGGTVSLTAVYESDLNADGTFKNPEKFGQAAKDPTGPDNQNSKTGSDPETKKFTISFIANGKTTTREVTADADGKATFTLDSAPTREGYTFKGWKNATDKETYNAGATVTVTGDTKYSAVWTKNGSTSTDSTSRSSDNKTTSSPRTGQATHLTGWLTSASLSALAAFALIRKQRRKDK